MKLIDGLTTISFRLSELEHKPRSPHAPISQEDFMTLLSIVQELVRALERVELHEVDL